MTTVATEATGILYTTGKLAKAAGTDESCDDFRKVFDAVGGEPYGWDTPIALATVLDVAGLDAALWALRCVPHGQEAERDRIARLFACDAAEMVLYLFEQEHPEDRRPREAIAVARRFTRGEASREELDAAWDAARDAARAAARDAAWDAAWDAARAAARARLAIIFRGYLVGSLPVS